MEKSTNVETESASSFSVDLLLGCLRRRRWWILLTASTIALLSLGALSILPKRYTSEATLVVVQQQVPERYVTPTANTDIGEALEAAQHEVLSRTQLLRVISEFDLYPRDKSSHSPEELEAKMRKQISLEPILGTGPNIKQINAFKISFVADNSQKAQAVASRLTQLFIEQNLETRERQSAVTTGFLKEQLDAAKAKLAQQEERVRDFKLENLGQLPEQQGGNLAVLAGLHGQLQNIMSSQAHAQEQQVYLQSLLNGYRSLATRTGSVVGPNGVTQSADPIVAAQANLAKLKSQRAALLTVDTPQHPDVIEKNTQIALAESELKALRETKVEPEAGAGHPPDGSMSSGSLSSTDNQMDASAAQLKSQLEANRAELENLRKDEKQVKAEIEQYQKRLNLTPVREQQLAGLLRDYEILKQDYTDLLGKETQSQLAGSLEKRQAGQQFKLVDSPSLPTIPSFPKPVVIGLGGAGTGIVLGAALAFLMDVKDGFLYSEDDLSRHFHLPLVMALPVLHTPEETRTRKWTMALEWVTASALVLAVGAAEFYELYVRRHG